MIESDNTHFDFSWVNSLQLDNENSRTIPVQLTSKSQNAQLFVISSGITSCELTNQRVDNKMV